MFKFLSSLFKPEKRPKSKHEFSASKSFEPGHVRLFLDRLADHSRFRLPTGDLGRIAGVVPELVEGDIRHWDITAHVAGVKTKIKVEITMDETQMPSLYIFGSREVIEIVEREMMKFSEEVE